MNSITRSGSIVFADVYTAGTTLNIRVLLFTAKGTPVRKSGSQSLRSKGASLRQRDRQIARNDAEEGVVPGARAVLSLELSLPLVSSAAGAGNQPLNCDVSVTSGSLQVAALYVDMYTYG